MTELREATAADLPLILAAEGEARRQGLVGGWTEPEHREAMGNPDCLYLVLEAGSDGRRVGSLILRGLSSPHGSLELKRIVVTETGHGHGRRALRLVKALAFSSLGAHRLWLDVFEHNTRARHLYGSEGFRVEGTLRECFRTPAGYASLVVMSVLEHEADHGAGLDGG